VGGFRGFWRRLELREVEDLGDLLHQLQVEKRCSSKGWQATDGSRRRRV